MSLLWKCNACNASFQNIREDLPKYQQPKVDRPGGTVYCPSCFELILAFRKELVNFNGTFEN